jgi:DNA-binding NtrC family response regulator
VSSPFVLVVSPDERWLRVLEVTLRVGGFTPIARRSVVEALRQREGDDRPTALVLDFGSESTAREVEAVREVLGSGDIPAIVILPERLNQQREAFEGTGVKVIVRPYPPSVLYQALRSPAEEEADEAAASEAAATVSPDGAARPGAQSGPKPVGPGVARGPVQSPRPAQPGERKEPTRKPFVPRPGYTADD